MAGTCSCCLPQCVPRRACTPADSNNPCVVKPCTKLQHALTPRTDQSSSQAALPRPLAKYLNPLSPPLSFTQTKDKWGFQMTARYDMYAEFFNRFVQHDFKPQVVRDPAL